MTHALLLAALLAAPTDTLLVSPQWLKSRLADPDLVVLQTGMERMQYDEAHIPGARWAAMDAFHSHMSPDQLPAPESIAAALGALGVSNRSRVVIAGDPLSASILFVALEYVGLRGRGAILDGGFAAWQASGGELSRDPPRITPATFTPRVNQELVVDARTVQGLLNRKGVALLDARSRGEYEGTAQEQLPRRGHLPGAAHLNWLDTFDPRDLPRRTGRQSDNAPTAARLKPAAALEQLFRAAGAEPGTEVVTYCTVGMRASHLYFVARLLGHPARIYVGSMADWTRDASRPVVSGGAP